MSPTQPLHGGDSFRWDWLISASRKTPKLASSPPLLRNEIGEGLRVGLEKAASPLQSQTICACPKPPCQHKMDGMDAAKNPHSENQILVAAFYKFAPLPDYRQLQPPLLGLCRALGLRGTILLAPEGINATIAGEPTAIEQVLAQLRRDPRLTDLDVKRSFHDRLPFQRMKVRLKREIVALKLPNIDPNQQVGEYVEPTDWNQLIAQDDVILVDARNDYEVRLGSFPRALNPETASFHQLPAYLNQRLDPQKHKRIAMFCTGGIRCEKATAYLLQQGFDQVYHLRGGILNYLERIEAGQSLWQGECFVFDERVSLDHNLQKGSITICDDCKSAVKVTDAQCSQCGSQNFL